jgi:glycosyltransferase involved in cell wall biosynthesis
MGVSMEKNYIMVSIAMITYNHERFLRQSLDSILEQEVNFKYEVIIGEDCSPDNSRAILKEYENRYPNIFKVIYRKENIGATKNAYDVLSHCKGKYIACLEGDDYWTDKNKLKTQIEFLENNKEYSGVYHITSISDENGNLIKYLPEIDFIKDNNIEKIESVSQLIELVYKDMGQIFHIQSLVYRNIYLQDFNSNKYKKLLSETKYIADIQQKLIVLEQGKIKLIDQVMGNYRVIRKTGNTSFSSQSKLTLYNDVVKSWSLIDEYFQYKYKSIIQKILVKEAFLISYFMLKNKNYKLASSIIINDMSLKDKFKFLAYCGNKIVRKIKKNIQRGE